MGIVQLSAPFKYRPHPAWMRPVPLTLPYDDQSLGWCLTVIVRKESKGERLIMSQSVPNHESVHNGQE